MFVRADLVDENVQCDFNKWKKELEQEDLREFGVVICRSNKDLELLHQMYLKSQYSEEFRQKRKKIYK